MMHIAPQRAGGGTFRFFVAGWNAALAPGDELITFLRREEDTGLYHEYSDTYRMPFRNGFLDWRRAAESPFSNGDRVEDVLDTLRALRGRPSQP